MKLSNDILIAKEYLIGKLNQKTNTVQNGKHCQLMAGLLVIGGKT